MSSHDGTRLTEEYVQDAFHSYLKSSLTQANAEKLLDAEVLASAVADLMITGPALCLYFAALRCTTNPPSVPLPRHQKNTQPLDLSTANCPPAFTSFLNVWCANVAPIQALAPELQHDLARTICNLPPVARGPAADAAHPTLNGIAADLRAVAIEISQRRSFQERYGGDLQAAIDAGGGGGGAGLKVKASFVPPPEYYPSPTSSAGSSPFPSPRPAQAALPQAPLPSPWEPLHPHPSARAHPRPPQDTSHLSPYPSVTGSSAGSGAGSGSGSRRTPTPPSPTLLAPDAPALTAIRETLYASLADVLARTPALRALLRTDPPRAYFASVALAVLEVATCALTPDGAVVGVLGRELALGECPPGLRPLMLELGGIGRLAREVEEADTEEAMRRAQAGEDVPPPRMERVRAVLQEGVGHDMDMSVLADADGGGGGGAGGSGRRSVEGRAVAFANRINELAMRMTALKQFRDRQEDVFKVLAGIGS